MRNNCLALFSVLSKKVTINPTNAVMVIFSQYIIYSTISVETYSGFVLPSGKDWIIILINVALC